MPSFNVVQYFSALERFASRIVKINELYSLSEKIERCPASTKYHGAHAGGLLDHLMSVSLLVSAVCRSMQRYAGDYDFQRKCEFCALVHDLGKLGTKEADFYLVNPDESKREKEPFIVNEKLISMPHELRTFYWLNELGITDLSEDEYQAIFFHAGPYTDGYLKMVRKESPLLVILHSADNLSTKIIEAKNDKQ